MTSLRLPTALSLLALAMLGARFVLTGSLGFAFFAWNLILAWAALALVLLATSLWKEQSRTLALAVGALAWLFFPNTIYLVTDLVYAGHARGVMRWCDTAMMGSFALAGVTLAIVCLERARQLVREHAGDSGAWALSAAVWLTSGAGVWLGRVRRWNSWDALLDPLEIVRDALAHFAHPRAHPESWATMLVFAALLAALQLGSALQGPPELGAGRVPPR